MKIALVVTGEVRQQINEFAHFLALSNLPQADYQCWQLPQAVVSEKALLALEDQFTRHAVDVLLFASGWQGAELATRLAYRLNGDALRDISHGDFVERHSVSKNVCGGNMTAELKLQNAPWCLSVAAAPGAEYPVFDCPVVQLRVEKTSPDWLISQRVIVENQLSGLAQAKRVLVAGRGVENADNMARLTRLAAQLGAQTGGSREAVMHAWCDMDRLIGLSGTQIAPEVCIVAGVSGASAFTCGISRSQFVIAINNDPQAPIFRQADVGIVDELMPVLEALVELVTTKA